MALKFPIAAGNWSNPAIWNNGTLPSVTDEVVGGSFDVNIDQDVTVYSLCNTPYRFFQDSLIDDHLGLTTSSTGTVLASGSQGGTSAPGAFSKFNFRSHIYWQSNVANTGWLGYYFTTAKVIKRYAFVSMPNNNIYWPKDWTFEGSNDGTTWTVLQTVTNYTGGTSFGIYISALVSNTTAYTRYRINMTSVASLNQQIVISRFDMTELTTTDYATYTNTFFLKAGVTLNLTYLIAGYQNETVKFTETSGTSTIPVSQPVYGINYRAIYCDAPSPAILNFYGTVGMGGIYNTAPQTIVKTNSGTINLIYNNSSTGRVIDSTGSGYQTGTAFYLTGGTANIVGEVYLNLNNATAILIFTGIAKTLNITGNLNYAGGNNYLILSYVSTNINITGNLYMSGAGIVLRITGSGTVQNINITGDIFSGSSAQWLLYSDTNVTCNVDHTGTIYGGTYPAFFNLVGTCKLSGPLIASQTTGVFPVQVGRLYFKNTPTYIKLYNSALTQTRTLYTSTYAPDYPLTSDVRYGVSYNSGAMTGTMKIPSVNNVTLGVNVDNTQGTAFLTPGQVPAAVWDYLTTNITNANSIGARLKNTLSPETLGQQIQNLLS